MVWNFGGGCIVKYIKLPADINDGQHHTLYGLRDGAYHLGEYLLGWLHTHDVGDSVELKIVRMPEAKANELEDI